MAKKLLSRRRTQRTLPKINFINSRPINFINPNSPPLFSTKKVKNNLYGSFNTNIGKQGFMNTSHIGSNKIIITSAPSAPSAPGTHGTHGGISPVNLKLYPSRTKRETRLIDRNPWGDKDKDRVPNIFDCRPLDKKKQDTLIKVYSKKAQKYIPQVRELAKREQNKGGLFGDKRAMAFPKTAKEIAKEKIPDKLKGIEVPVSGKTIKEIIEAEGGVPKFKNEQPKETVSTVVGTPQAIVPNQDLINSIKKEDIKLAKAASKGDWIRGMAKKVSSSFVRDKKATIFPKHMDEEDKKLIEKINKEGEFAGWSPHESPDVIEARQRRAGLNENFIQDEKSKNKLSRGLFGDKRAMVRPPKVKPEKNKKEPIKYKSEYFRKLSEEMNKPNVTQEDIENKIKELEPLKKKEKLALGEIYIEPPSDLERSIRNELIKAKNPEEAKEKSKAIIDSLRKGIFPDKPKIIDASSVFPQKSIKKLQENYNRHTPEEIQDKGELYSLEKEDPILRMSFKRNKEDGITLQVTKLIDNIPFEYEDDLLPDKFKLKKPTSEEKEKFKFKTQDLAKRMAIDSGALNDDTSYIQFPLTDEKVKIAKIKNVLERERLADISNSKEEKIKIKQEKQEMLGIEPYTQDLIDIVDTNAVQDIKEQEPSQDIVEDMVEGTTPIEIDLTHDTSPYEGSAQELIDKSDKE